MAINKLLTEDEIAADPTGGVSMSPGSMCDQPTPDNDMYLGQFVSRTMRAQTISGTARCVFQWLNTFEIALQPPTVGTFMTAIIVKVCSSDGTTIRGTLISLIRETGIPEDRKSVV